MAAPLFFLTTNVEKFEEIADLFDEDYGIQIDRRTARLPPPPSNTPGEVAKFRALEAFKVLKSAVFAEAVAIELADGALSGASFRQAFEMPEGAGWLNKHDGHTGVARVAVGHCADGRESQVFEVAIPGKLVKKGKGDGNAPWERHWIPDGKAETLAELAGPDADELQNKPYIDLAKLLKK